MHFLHLPNWFFLQDEHWRRIEKKRIQYFFTYHHPPSLSNLNQFEVQVSPIIAFSQTVVFSNFSINEKVCMVKPKVFSDGECTADNHNFIRFCLRQYIARGRGTRGAGGPGPPLELKIYRVKFLKNHKMSFFLLLGPPLDKICSVAPG